MQVDSGFGRRRARIEMIALIDVVFLLLVFFIYAMLSMTVFRGLELDLPRAEGVFQPETIVVTLDRDNRLIAEDRVMESSRIVSWAMAEHSRTGSPVLIRGDREADLGVALGLLAELQEAGLEAVSFQVEEERP
ncbi:MAG: biopolymer transporter ExbD [Spirochaetales bacterium]|nr:biopolymer transporter ExbD [Spirochaetales bacterium]